MLVRGIFVVISRCYWYWLWCFKLVGYICCMLLRMVGKFCVLFLWLVDWREWKGVGGSRIVLAGGRGSYCCCCCCCGHRLYFIGCVVVLCCVLLYCIKKKKKIFEVLFFLLGREKKLLRRKTKLINFTAQNNNCHSYKSSEWK